MWFLLLASCVKQADVDALRLEVALLNARVNALEADPAGAGRAGVAEVGDTAAKALLAEAQAALTEWDFARARSALERIVAEYPSSTAAPTAARMLEEVRVVGQPAPEIAAASWFQGRYAYADAPLTLVVFFETWCPHCQREMPNTEALLNEWRTKGLGVVAFTKVTRSATDDSVRAFIREHHLSFPVAKEQDGTMSTAYAVTGIPAAALVKDGVVVWRGHPARLTPELLKGFLK